MTETVLVSLVYQNRFLHYVVVNQLASRQGTTHDKEQIKTRRLVIYAWVSILIMDKATAADSSGSNQPLVWFYSWCSINQQYNQKLSDNSYTLLKSARSWRCEEIQCLENWYIMRDAYQEKSLDWWYLTTDFMDKLYNGLLIAGPLISKHRQPLFVILRILHQYHIINHS